MHLRQQLGLAFVVCIYLNSNTAAGAEKWAKCTINATSGEPTQSIEGTVYFKDKGSGPVMVWINLVGFDTTDQLDVHGFHVHLNGELGNKCADAGGHYNPEDVVHGGPTDSIRHVGDLGNIVEDSEGNVHTTMEDSVIQLSGSKSIIGKSVVVHATFDDLGKGGFSDSNSTGHAGARLGCCVIESTTAPSDGPWEEQLADCKIESTSGVTSQPIEGVVIFRQPPGFADVVTTVDLSGFDTTDGLDVHGFHIHDSGELGNQCKDAGGHFNPENELHGGPDDDVRHVGDLGNLDEVNGEVHKVFSDRMIRLTGPHGIVGRSVVVHETFDDFNTGDFPDSNTTGHAGSRLGCCTIKEAARLSEAWAKCEMEATTGTDQPVEGTVIFYQPEGYGDVEISVSLSGFDNTDGLSVHGFHIHESGDLGDQCKDAGSHYNPSGALHGGPQDAIRHVGDLGNVDEDAHGNVNYNFTDRMIKLSGSVSIMGRAVVVHETFDDFNTGNEVDSNTTGHAGARLGCCKIESYTPGTGGVGSLAPVLLVCMISIASSVLMTWHL